MEVLKTKDILKIRKCFHQLQRSRQNIMWCLEVILGMALPPSLPQFLHKGVVLATAML